MNARMFFKNEDPDDTGITELEDSSPMPFGQHEKTEMKDVPAKYLLWMNDNLVEREQGGQKLRDDEKAVMSYVQERIEAIELEAEEEEDE